MTFAQNTQVKNNKAPNHNFHESVPYYDLSAVYAFIDKMDAIKEAERKKALSTIGFVSVVSNDDLDQNGPRMIGIYVKGQNRSFEVICRHLRATSNAPEWFHKALASEELNPTGKQFRVRVVGLAKSGVTAFVVPMAKDEKQADREWQREKKKIDERPKKIYDNITRSEVAYLAYEKVAEENNMVIVKYDEESMTALLAPLDDALVLYHVKDGNDIWDFTGGINKGVTTLEDEIARCVKMRRIR